MKNKVIKRVKFLSRSSMLHVSPMPDWAAILIAEDDTEINLKPGWYAINRAKFNDVCPEHSNNKDKPRILMSSRDADNIVGFIESVTPYVEMIFVSCKGGISRSPAVAKWIAERFNLKFDHDYSLYNKHVYKLMCEAGQRYKQRIENAQINLSNQGQLNLVQALRNTDQPTPAMKELMASARDCKMPTSIADLTQDNDIADLRISTQQDIAEIAGQLTSDQIKDKMNDWRFITLHRFYPDDKQIYLLCDQSREPGGAVISSYLKTIDLEHQLVETRNGSLHSLGTPRVGEPSQQQLAMLCIAMHKTGIGSFIGVPIPLQDGTYFTCSCLERVIHVI